MHAHDRSQVFDSAKGGRAKLEAIDAKLASFVDEKKRENYIKKHAKSHGAQMLRRPPLLPFHHVVFDIMHAIHNEANVILDEGIHKHLMIDSPDAAVKKVIATAQSNINKLWKEANLPKFIQFGKDTQGAHSHALNGPAFKAVWRNPELLIKTIKLMEPVWALLETRKQTPPLEASAVGVGADRGPKAAAQKRGGGGKGNGGGSRKKKAYGVTWDDEAAGGEGALEEGQASTDQNERQVSHGPPRNDHETYYFSLFGNNPTPFREESYSNHPYSQVPAAAPDLTYSQRFGAAFVAFIQFYEFITKDHGKPASELDETARSALGDEAVGHALTMQRAMLALIGTHRRRTYAHDLVYGTHQLYMLFGKPWHAATEGNEHAHQDMKAFFHDMACHSGKGHGDCYAVLRLTIVKRHLLQERAQLLPNSKYAAMRANKVLAEDAEVKEGKKRVAQSGPVGLKMYAEDTRMGECSKRIQMEVVEGRAP